jgi:hypothetical protein
VSDRARGTIGLRQAHNDSVACIHGNDPSTCSVCQTLAEIDTLSGTPGSGKGGGGRARQPRSGGGGGGGGAGRFRRLRADHDGGERPGRVDIITGRGRPPSTRSVGTHVAIFVVVLVIAAASVWIVAGLVFALIHLIEIIVVAGVAGTIGYRLGHYRGRHEG